MITPPTVEQLNKIIAKKKFSEFVKQAWPIIEPNTPLQWNWHLDVMCDHLQAVREGKIKNLIINIPFRLSKSIICSVLYPAWVWLSDPAHKFVGTSHTHKTVLENSIKMRRVVVSDWYKSFFPGGFNLVKDTESYFTNNYSGHRQSYSVETSVTGITANTLIIDDPMTTETASSKLERERIERTIAFDFMTRLTPPGKGACIIVMQRLHTEDTSGKYLKDDAWDRIVIPAVWDGDNRSKTSLGFKDPRQEIGESIFPEYMTDEFISSTKLNNGNQFFASQLQQRPVAAEGSIIHYEWIKTYKELPEVVKYSISCDTAIKTGTNNDYSVIQLWAQCESGFYLVDMIRKKLEYPALKAVIQAFYDQNPASEMIIEDKASGQQLTQDFKSFSKIPVIPVIPGRDMPSKKDERLQLVSGLFEAGKIYIPERAPWKLDFMQEICEFGYQPHDDIVDATTQYLSRQLLRRNKVSIRML